MKKYNTNHSFIFTFVFSAQNVEVIYSKSSKVDYSKLDQLTGIQREITEMALKEMEKRKDYFLLKK